MQHWNSILNLDRVIQILICGALRDLVPSVQFKKREKHQWRSVTFSKVAGFLHGCFTCFLNCTNGTKSRNAPHMGVDNKF